jgi:hypothetical protein
LFDTVTMMQINALRPRDAVSPQDRALLAHASGATSTARQEAAASAVNAAASGNQSSRAVVTARAGLAQTPRTLDANSAAQEADWARGFADAFEGMTRELASPASGRKAQSQYELLAGVGAALSGISRQRTQSLLALRD